VSEPRYIGPAEPDEQAREDVLPDAEPDLEPEAGAEVGADAEPAAEAEAAPDEPDETAADDQGEAEPESEPLLRAEEHAEGELDIPDGYAVLEGYPDGMRRGVAVVVSRFNGEITSRLLESALAELGRAGVPQEAVTIVPVPGAFELPLGAMAFAKTRRYACVIALGCVIRGETPHFEYVAGEAASGLQLAALETGVPVSFGVLTVETREQAEARVGKGAEAVLSALEMADLFSQLRSTAGAAAR
jgi:6,7-dimethyl-8-ribityllumazine synthase